jgi:hypothetical protein
MFIWNIIRTRIILIKEKYILTNFLNIIILSVVILKMISYLKILWYFAGIYKIKAIDKKLLFFYLNGKINIYIYIYKW